MKFDDGLTRPRAARHPRLLAPSLARSLPRSLAQDVLNSDGGTVEYLDNGHALVEFGKLVHGGASNAARDDVHTRVFEVVPDEASGTATAVAEIRVPRAHMKDSQFRVAPRASVAGESAQAPFELELARR